MGKFFYVGSGVGRCSLSKKRGVGVNCLLCESALIKYVGGMLGKRKACAMRRNIKCPSSILSIKRHLFGFHLALNSNKHQCKTCENFISHCTY